MAKSPVNSLQLLALLSSGALHLCRADQAANVTMTRASQRCSRPWPAPPARAPLRDGACRSSCSRPAQHGLHALDAHPPPETSPRRAPCAWSGSRVRAPSVMLTMIISKKLRSPVAASPWDSYVAGPLRNCSVRLLVRRRAGRSLPCRHRRCEGLPRCRRSRAAGSCMVASRAALAPEHVERGCDHLVLVAIDARHHAFRSSMSFLTSSSKLTTSSSRMRSPGGSARSTAITAFRVPKPDLRKEARSLFLSTAPIYREVPGLFLRTYVLSDDGMTAGGIYFWNSRPGGRSALHGCLARPCATGRSMAPIRRSAYFESPWWSTMLPSRSLPTSSRASARQR